jgi:carbonic anhydrase
MPDSTLQRVPGGERTDYGPAQLGLTLRRASLLSVLFLLACGEKDVGETADTSDSADTGDTGDVETCDITPVVYDYSDQAAWVEDHPDCGKDAQSPIDIGEETLSPAEMDGLAFSYGTTPLRVVNNGHSIEFEVQAGSSITLGGQTYDTRQFHFHSPSEHTVNGEHTPMEMHLVHADGDDLAVVGVFILEGNTDHPWFADAGWDALPETAGECVEDEEVSLDLNGLLGSLEGGHPSVAFYSGSLTTPPCSEQVSWVLMEQVLTLSSGQIEAFTDLYVDNNRDTQALNDRPAGYDTDYTQ